MGTVSKTIVGYVLGERQFPNKHGHIVSLAVMRDYRGQGLAKKLLQSSIMMMEKLFGLESVSLNARVSNSIALKLYTGLGFREHKREPGYYADGEDGIDMFLQIGEKAEIPFTE